MCRFMQLTRALTKGNTVLMVWQIMEQVHKHFHMEKMGIRLWWQLKIILNKKRMYHLGISMIIFILNNFISFWFVVSIGYFNTVNFPGNHNGSKQVFAEWFQYYYLSIHKKIWRFIITFFKIEGPPTQSAISFSPMLELLILSPQSLSPYLKIQPFLL